MAGIKECVNQKVKINSRSITIKDEKDKTCGVVRNIISLYDLQVNKQMDYCKKIHDIGIWGKISIKDCIISNDTMYIFRNRKRKLFQEIYGYISDDEVKKANEQEDIFNIVKAAGIEVIECIYV